MCQAKNVNKMWEDNVVFTSLISNGFLSFLYQIDRENSTDCTGIVEFAFGHIVGKIHGAFLKTKSLSHPSMVFRHLP